MIYSIRSQQYHLRISAIAFVLGLVIFFAASAFHPSQEPAHLSARAFAEYAHSADWIDAHLGQFFGALILFLGFVSASQYLKADSEPTAAISSLLHATAIIAIALVGVLQAVDGPALKYMVDRWAAAPAADSDAAFRAAEAVRWIEVGVNSYFRIAMGLTLSLLGGALVFSRQLPRWLGYPGLVAGAGTIWQGVQVGNHGFEVTTPLIAIPTLLTFAWLFVAALVMWLRSNTLPGAELLQGERVEGDTASASL